MTSEDIGTSESAFWILNLAVAVGIGTVASMPLLLGVSFILEAIFPDSFSAGGEGLANPDGLILLGLLALVVASPLIATVVMLTRSARQNSVSARQLLTLGALSFGVIATSIVILLRSGWAGPTEDTGVWIIFMLPGTGLLLVLLTEFVLFISSRLPSHRAG